MSTTRFLDDVTPATLANAIAYVNAAQTMRGLHGATKGAVMDHYIFADCSPHYRFTEDAIARALTSRLGKAHKWLVDHGYRLRSYGPHGLIRHSMRMIEFWNPEMEMFAFTGRNGDIMLVPEDGYWGGRTTRFNPSRGTEPVFLKSPPK
jgi:hypothetical protein